MGTWTRGGSDITDWWYEGPTGHDYTAQWQRCTPVCVNVPTPPIPDSDGLFYRLSDADLGATMRVVLSVRYSNSAEQTTARATSEEVGPVVPDTQVIDTALAQLRLPRAATTRSPLHAGGFRSRFGAPAAGSLAVSWSQVAGKRRSPMVLARAAERYARGKF